MGFLQSVSQVVMAMTVLFLLLLVFSLLVGEPGTGGYVLAQLSLVPVVITFVASVIVIYTGWEPF
ncbi:hypothetical protein Harman_38130 [Haloarcula mannanilytica]|uniref:Uncharacterized protein n=1 Tax=Haloarcula mannanilytica TaxID=2509225 RepID=A0A4C2EMR0_9EURY|nr:hypothetical protein [Haloarcula mannanilytica]GCF15878.1 hypothetical protein Harman_38130 [Haloarcula mannanilytica]